MSIRRRIELILDRAAARRVERDAKRALDRGTGVEEMGESFGRIEAELASRSDRRTFKAARLAAMTLAKRLRDVNHVLAGGRGR